VAFGLWYRKQAVTREGAIFRIDGDRLQILLRKNGWLPAGERRKTKKRAEPREESARAM